MDARIIETRMLGWCDKPNIIFFLWRTQSTANIKDIGNTIAYIIALFSFLRCKFFAIIYLIMQSSSAQSSVVTIDEGGPSRLEIVLRDYWK